MIQGLFFQISHASFFFEKQKNVKKIDNNSFQKAFTDSP